MKIEKNVLNEALRVLGKVVWQTSPEVVLRSVRFFGTPGNVRVMATDGTEVVSLAVDAECEGDVDFCVEHRELREMVRIGKGALEIDGSKVEYPTLAVAPEDAVSVALPKDFCSLLALAAPIVDRQEARPALQGINLSRDGVTATNGRELLNLPCPLDLNEDFTLPFPLALLTAKLDEPGTLQIWREKDCRYFRMEIGRFIWIGKAQPGTFPNWKQVVPVPQSLDYSVTIHEVARVIDFLKTVPDHPPFHGIELNVTTDGVSVISNGQPNMKLDVAADHVGRTPRAVLALNKHVLQRMLTQGYKTFRANADGRIPVVAEGGHGKYIAMPIHILPKQKIQSKNNQENQKMEEIKPEVTLSPLDELNSNVEELRGKLKTLFDESGTLLRKVKEATLQQKQKEREFIQAKRAIERIKMAI